ncbi:hypothetical protein GQ55_3G039600 [Panicum hallii var. hallii]|uniref:GDSL esterase/lipase n=1 Tax=Panicum hallii var. hallii TaxID=1504633 RepID=A0A2T7E5I2_9POAL|nr:hypothetical protein GQ55_3G039600 [Panicum hallii var. hallii]
MGGGGRRLVPAAFVAAALVLVVAAVFVSSAEAETAAASLRGGGPFDSIFAFGDSFTDTGNNPVVFGWYDIFDVVMRPPYGMTFFGGLPTGRNCNGRLVIDFIAQGLGLPLVPPYLSHKGSFRQGANFAVGSATGLNSSFFHIGDAPGANPFPLNISLEVQLGWFEELKPSLCKTDQECKDFFGRSLFFVGEFGINDYQYSFGKKSMQEIRAFVPDLIQTISMGAERVIKHGAKTLVIPGMIPSGCAPPVLVTFADSDASEYDAATGCLKEPNEIVTLHNSLLRDAVEKLRAKHPDVSIIHTDLFNHVMEMVQSPEKFGFKRDALTICCGGPGRYHYNLSVVCGDEAATTCEDPSTRLFWDGVHLTEAAYHYIAEDWLNTIVGSVSARASS